MGWSSWNLVGCAVNETLIREIADSLVSSGLAELGYIHVNIDDCWQSARDPSTGLIIADPQTFPSGIPALADYVHSLGLRLGIYSSAGSKTCEGRPGSLGHEEIDARTYAAWGVDYLKYDNCYEEGLSDWRGTAARYAAMGAALAGVDRPITYSICNWGFANPWEFGPAVGAASWRTTSDICDSFTGSWCSVTAILDLSADLFRFAGPTRGFNDLDMLEVGNAGLSGPEARAHFSAWAALKSPLILGNDLRSMSRNVRDLLANAAVVAVNQDPLGVPASRVRRTPKGIDVFAGPLADGDVVLLLLNRAEVAQRSVPVPLADFGADPKTARPMAVVNLWAGYDLDGESSEARAVGTDLVVPHIAGHGVAMYRISPHPNQPFGPVFAPPTGTYPVGEWWYWPVMFVRWYKTRTEEELRSIGVQVVTASVALVIAISSGFRALRWTTPASGKRAPLK
ncbi:hypothetical protein HK405_005035 [Cladochytrium tenue]|nr:hypothetical protein HK405_005035 [Cladochytrium tenue]